MPEEWPDRWFVTNGVVAVGPVSFGRLLQGVAQGQIPEGSVVRHESWHAWRRLEDIGPRGSDGRQQTVEGLALLSSSLELCQSSPVSEPPPRSRRDRRNSSVPPVEPPVRSAWRPVRVDPASAFEKVEDLGEALVVGLSMAVPAAAADVGIVHSYRADVGGMLTVGGHGPGTELLLGERVADSDPTLTAARAGSTILAEAEFGENGRHLLGRLERCLAGTRGVAMVPLVLYGELVAMFELGRRNRAFRAREIARAEDVVDALAERSVVMGWLE
jgi:hypothetical protein